MNANAIRPKTRHSQVIFGSDGKGWGTSLSFMLGVRFTWDLIVLLVQANVEQT